jgi:hypothetical protein
MFGDRDGFFIETVTLPDTLADLSCGLYGPLMGDAPVSDLEARYLVRPPRQWPSRVVTRELRPVRTLSVIAGPSDDDTCVLYTAFGGPVAPQEPNDPGCRDTAASQKFWAEHALAYREDPHA